MVKRVTIYDCQTGEALERNTLTANEAIANDPKRYRKRPWTEPERRAYAKRQDAAGDGDADAELETSKPAKSKAGKKPAKKPAAGAAASEAGSEAGDAETT